MASEHLIQAVKQIASLSRAGQVEQAYEGYRALFSDPVFQTYGAEDQRRALKLMVHTKRRENIAPPYLVEAHRAAIAPLMELAAAFGEPSDFEMLGMCQVLAGDEQGASVSFRAGLNIERSRNPQSDLCGSLMKWVASV
ncbi:MAG TPA: hypothetical protein PKW66_18700 [Polyangiaceae bacterium]|nr:hypothetical protein [Polyangiaceae bacterium]